MGVALEFLFAKTNKDGEDFKGGRTDLLVRSNEAAAVSELELVLDTRALSGTASSLSFLANDLLLFLTSLPLFVSQILYSSQHLGRLS